MNIEFGYRPAVKIFWRVVSALLVTGLAIFFIIRGHLTEDAIQAILLLCAICAVGLINIETKVRLDDEGIRIQRIIGRRFLRWSDIDDVICSPRLLLISSNKRNQQIKIYSRDFGLSSDTFNELRRIVNDRTGQFLLEKWRTNALPIAFNSRSLSIGTSTAYLSAFAVALLLFFGLVSKSDRVSIRHFLFLLVGILVIAPFFIRDYRRFHKNLICDREGLREKNGKEKFMPWSSITEIVIKDLPGSGYGFINILDTEGHRIQVPRSFKNCGQLIYLLKSYARVSES